MTQAKGQCSLSKHKITSLNTSTNDQVDLHKNNRNTSLGSSSTHQGENCKASYKAQF